MLTINRRVTLISCLRLAWLVSFTFKPIRDQGDFTYNIGLVWGNIEANLAIMSACAPALRGLVGHWFPSFLTTFGSSNGHSASHGHMSGGGGRGDQHGVGVGSHIQLRSFEDGQNKGLSNHYHSRETKGHARFQSQSPGTSEEDIVRYVIVEQRRPR